MDVAGAKVLVEVVGGVDPGCRDRAMLTGAVGALARLRAWLDGREVELAALLAQVASFPEQAIADAARSSLRDAGRVLERAQTTATVVELGEALAAGSVSGGHVDVVGRVLRRLEPHQRRRLVDRAQWLVEVAAGATPGELERTLSGEVRRLQTDDGMARLQRQRQASRLRSWVDRDGMWCLAGRYDPETGALLQGRLAATVDALYADHVPPGCPSDPLERHGFLRAHALAALTRDGAGWGQPELIVVLDTTSADRTGAPTVDWGLPVELPVTVLQRLAARADIHPVVVHQGLVLHTPGQINLGRTTRLANRAQRRALRALYPTCAVPGCDIRYQQCKIHHVHWWEHGGPTDLHNLVPLCVTHHHAVHDRHWQLTLTPQRQLTISYPDGTTDTTGPPRRTARPDVGIRATNAGTAGRRPSAIPLRT